MCLIKGSCQFTTSDFPSENPRTQTRNYSYTKPLGLMLEDIAKPPSLGLKKKVS